MRLLKASGGSASSRRSSAALCTYQVGQRTVQLFELTDGHIQWVCTCDDYAASAGSVHGAWCKHVAKASAIRSIERLTGARVVGRSRSQTTARSAVGEPIRADDAAPVQALVQSH
jgi:hypothetical protein